MLRKQESNWAFVGYSYQRPIGPHIVLHTFSLAFVWLCNFVPSSYEVFYGDIDRDPTCLLLTLDMHSSQSKFTELLDG